MDAVKSILKFILIAAAVSGAGGIFIAIGLETRALPLHILGIILTLLGPVVLVILLYFRFIGYVAENFGKIKNQTTELKQQNLLKRRFHEKKRLISETGKHRADLTRDLKSEKNAQDEILEEFFAGINLDMKAVEFSKAKEITLEHLKGAKAPKKQKIKPTQKTQKVAT